MICLQFSFPIRGTPCSSPVLLLAVLNLLQQSAQRREAGSRSSGPVVPPARQHGASGAASDTSGAAPRAMPMTQMAGSRSRSLGDLLKAASGAATAPPASRTAQPRSRGMVQCSSPTAPATPRGRPPGVADSAVSSQTNGVAIPHCRRGTLRTTRSRDSAVSSQTTSVATPHCAGRR